MREGRRRFEEGEYWTGCYPLSQIAGCFILK